jgi:hypothetical protein
MKTKAERLDEILDKAREFTDFEDDISYDYDAEELKKEIIALFKECVPEETPNKTTYIQMGFNLCREETLKNIEEMGK